MTAQNFFLIVQNTKTKSPKRAAILTLVVLGAFLLTWLIWLARSHPRVWRQAVTFVEAFGGLLGVVVISACVAGVLVAADFFMRDERSSPCDRASGRSADDSPGTD